jgi:hypothetical protein
LIYVRWEMIAARFIRDLETGLWIERFERSEAVERLERFEQ